MRSVVLVWTDNTHSSSLYDFTVKDAAGKDFPLSKLKDKKAILVVNVASQCTFEVVWG